MTYESMLAETVAFRGHKGDVGEAYYAVSYTHLTLPTTERV